MPKVRGRHFAYTEKGRKAADEFKKKGGKSAEKPGAHLARLKKGY